MSDDAAITDDLRAFLDTIDTAYLATADASGQPYVQHRGGPKGFIRALDDHTLAFADYNGNRQYISTGNLRENDKVCLFLIDYAHRQRVKVWGTMREVPPSPELLAMLAPVPPKTRVERVLVLTVTRWDVNCPKHIPVKVNANDVAATLEKLQARIAALEIENARLRG